ncbi:uncharacterized protein BXZ73DRAFT_107552 [Epithele typhae]|uniref:uncharacterized protein n=1 Tax=Epithele typhae TaxID=378194 RepID=UPI002007E443|nr:uncharacterized protein BXZ73DRAFT_107552 [Epithele typhae]KAH9912184.1 hypothetical protein BXZ73DRAFT_107552 [Epithele typhae]
MRGVMPDITNTRPQTGVGNNPNIYPIVVCCAHRDDAEAINGLNRTVFHVTPANDVHLAAWRVQEANIPLRGSPVYGVRIALDGRHTGLFIGIPWTHVGFQIGDGEPNVQQKGWCKRFDLKGLPFASAMAYMMVKKGHNFPIDFDVENPIPARSAPDPRPPFPAPLRAPRTLAPSLPPPRSFVHWSAPTPSRGSQREQAPPLSGDALAHAFQQGASIRDHAVLPARHHGDVESCGALAAAIRLLFISPEEVILLELDPDGVAYDGHKHLGWDGVQLERLYDAILYPLDNDE